MDENRRDRILQQPLFILLIFYLWGLIHPQLLRDLQPRADPQKVEQMEIDLGLRIAPPDPPPPILPMPYYEEPWMTEISGKFWWERKDPPKF